MLDKENVQALSVLVELISMLKIMNVPLVMLNVTLVPKLPNSVPLVEKTPTESSTNKKVLVTVEPVSMEKTKLLVKDLLKLESYKSMFN